MVESEWLPQLEAARASSFVATKRNWKELARTMNKKREGGFMRDMGRLRASHEKLQSIRDPTGGQPFELFPPVSVSG